MNENKILIHNNITPIDKGTKEGAYCSVTLTGKFMIQKW